MGGKIRSIRLSHLHTFRLTRALPAGTSLTALSQIDSFPYSATVLIEYLKAAQTHTTVVLRVSPLIRVRFCSALTAALGDDLFFKSG